MIRANATTIRRHRALGLPLVVERNGQIVEVSPFEVPLPEVPPEPEPSGGAGG